MNTVKNKMPATSKFKKVKSLFCWEQAALGVVTAFLWSHPAYAQLTTLTNGASMVCLTVKNLGYVVFLIGITWVALEMMIKKQMDWGHAAKVVGGAFVLGGAVQIAQWTGISNGFGTGC